MALFDLIYNWFITHVFNVSNSNSFSSIVYSFGDNSTNLTLCEWLSCTFTIIVLTLLVIFLILFVKWIFKLFAGLLGR